MPDTQIELLGTGTPNAGPDRMGSSLAIIAMKRPIWLILGPALSGRQQPNWLELRHWAVKNLEITFLTQLLMWGCSGAELAVEIKYHYTGSVVCGQDLGIY